MVHLPLRDPTEVPVGEMHLAEPLDLSFEGFTEAAFACLDRLRAHPHIGQYQADKAAIGRTLQAPFKRYRDDLVVNWVLPNRLGFETERNVFSRLLKNDFGAGGSHHHLWMAFYRPGRRRLHDAQLAHSLSPEGLTVGLFIGAAMKALLATAKARVAADPAGFLGTLNPLLQDEELVIEVGKGRQRRLHRYAAPLATVPEALARAEGFWVRTRIERAEVLRLGPALVSRALAAVLARWPLYRFLVPSDGTSAPAAAR